MAETITFFVDKLSNLAVQEASLFGGVEGQISLLRNELEWISLFLEEASAAHTDDRRLKLWMNQIRDAAYDAEDVIDKFIVRLEHQRQRRLQNLKFLRVVLPTCVIFADKLPLVHELDGRMKEINDKIEKILVNKSRYCVENAMIPSGAWSSSSPNEVVTWGEKRLPIVEEADVVGMKDEAEAVKEMLLINGELERGVVAIVGMGGLGKTTLAKKVYNDPDVNGHFQCRTLVYVSQVYTIRELLMGIANNVMPETDHMRNMDENQLGNEVCKYLDRKRYLIVLDDVWSIQVWNGLCLYLPESNGSRVLITTRNQQIALDAYAKLYRLRPLGEKESWELFLKKTFPTGSRSTISQVVCPAELEDVGKKITGKCKGLPLAIVVSGGLLSRKEKTPSSWEKILKSMEWHLSQGPESCMGILALSYRDLPYFLKSCFLYCGVFPEDCEIKASKLIQMWVAEGFVQARGEETVEEDVGEDYLEELIHRSMIQVVKRKWDGRVKSCRMHDLLRDLAISKAKDSKFFEVRGNIFAYPFNPRRLIAHDSQNISQHLSNCHSLRSLICSIHIPRVNFWSCLRSAKLLTVLDLTLRPEKKLPKEIGEFIHLKYFRFLGPDQTRFPWSIGRLINLETLDLRDNFRLDIPFSIWKLHQLRHLYLGTYPILRMPIHDQRCFSSHLGIDKLTNLQTLHVERLEWVVRRGLPKLTQLRKLYIGEPNMSSNISYELIFPSNLVEYTLAYCHLKQDPMLTLGKLPNLRALKLIHNAYIGEEITCSSGAFSQLEFLRLNDLTNLKELIVEERALPSLKTLQIYSCYQMGKLLHQLQKLKSLQQVELEDMNDSLIEEIKNTKGEEFDKIRLITSIT